MTQRMKLILATLLGLGAGTVAVAETAVEDANGDGVYSMDELVIAFPTLTEETFGIMDGNGDGAVDPEELAAADAAGLLTAG